MSAAAARDILYRLADLGAKVDRHGDRLILRAGAIPVPRGILATVRAHKAQVLHELVADERCRDLEERASIVERDSKIPRGWAEGFACLDPDRPPGDVPLRRWQRFVDDVGRFLDGPFCAVAASLGWGPHDLFGCDRDRPFARIDKCGLLWLLNGDKLVALSENTATIETPTGARQTWRRKPSEPGRALAWELA